MPEKEVWCKILDAVFKEELGSDDEPTYVNSIAIRLQDVENKEVYDTVLSQDSVREITGISRPISSKEMIYLADLLRSRDMPVKFCIPVGQQNVDLKTIKDSSKLDEIAEPISLDEGVIEMRFSKFSNKKKQKKENE